MYDYEIEWFLKKEAKKPIINYKKYEDSLHHCPSCGKVLPERAVYGESNFCYKCGQKLKWE